MIKCITLPAPRAGRDWRDKDAKKTYCISIHAPRAGRDTFLFDKFAVYLKFQSTRPVRGATIYATTTTNYLCNISIHAPRAGRDSKSIQNYFTHFCDKRQFLDNFTQNAAF